MKKGCLCLFPISLRTELRVFYVDKPEKLTYILFTNLVNCMK